MKKEQIVIPVFAESDERTDIKRCLKGHYRAVEDFGKDRGQKDGLTRYCKYCRSKHFDKPNFSYLNNEYEIKYGLKPGSNSSVTYLKSEDRTDIEFCQTGHYTPLGSIKQYKLKTRFLHNGTIKTDITYEKLDLCKNCRKNLEKTAAKALEKLSKSKCKEFISKRNKEDEKQ